MSTGLVDIDFGGSGVAGQSVNVLVHGTQTSATLFDRDGVTPLTNPLTLTGNGHAVFQVAAGTYDLVGASRTRTVVVTDPAAAPIRGTTLTSLSGHVFALSVDDTGHLSTTQLS